MLDWLRRIRGAVGMGLIWAVVWAAVSMLKASFVDPIGSIDKLWLGPPIGMFPGFVGGLVFSALLGIAAGDRRLDELSVSKVAAWGGAVGFVLGLLPMVINKPPSEFPVWMVGAVVIGSLTLLGAVSAAGSLMLARKTKAREIPGATSAPR